MSCFVITRRGSAGGGGTITDYTDLATLLAASGTAGARAQLTSAGGSSIGMWRYSGNLAAWVPDGMIDFTVSGANTAIGAARIVTLAGAPGWSSGPTVTAGAGLNIKLFDPELRPALIDVVMTVDATYTGGTPAVGGDDYLMVGWHTDAGYGFGPVNKMTEAAAAYVPNVGWYYGATGAVPNSTVVAQAAPTTPGLAGTISARNDSATTHEIAYTAASSLVDRSDASSIGTASGNLGFTATDSLDGVHIGVENSGTGHGGTLTVQRVHITIQEA